MSIPNRPVTEKAIEHWLGNIRARIWQNHENSAAKWCITVYIGNEQILEVYHIVDLAYAEGVADGLIGGVDKAYWMGRKACES